MDSLDEELMDLPYFRRVREAHEEGREEGLRHSITNVLIARFNPDTTFQERFSRHLETQKGLESLDRLLLNVTQVDSLEMLETLIGR